MKINSINCCKPHPRFSQNLSSDEARNNHKLEHSSSEKKKVLYKHLELMDNKTLKAYSIAKAYNQVENSNKMRLFKALPEITTIALGATIGLAQPGKVSTKLMTGLGFLALSSGVTKVSEKISNDVLDIRKKDNKNNNEPVSSFVRMAAFTGVAAAAIGVVSLALTKGKDLISAQPNKVTNFLSGEFKKLSSEIDGNKIVQNISSGLNEFKQKHPKLTSTLKAISPFGVISIGNICQVSLSDDLSHDFKENAKMNFIHGKKVQQKAQEHFEQIKAQEV